MNGKRPFPLRAARALYRVVTDRNYRIAGWLRLMRSQATFQPYNFTGSNRYPRIFRFVQSELGRDAQARILSFGCSTGEEVFSLRGYFPRAVIKGIDLSGGNIAVCRRRLRLRRKPDPGITFETVGSTSGEASSSYDAIFCMAVLRHGELARPGVERCDHLIRFEDFAAAVADFARCLKPGGLLIIRHSNFRLCDAPAGANFETILRVEGAAQKGVPLFGPDNRLLSGVSYFDTVFRKKPA